MFMFPALLLICKPAQNNYTFAERFILSQNFSSKNLHPVSKLSVFFYARIYDILNMRLFLLIRQRGKLEFGSRDIEI